ncbi:MAG: 23S rRNA (adenine(2503)-C(2))-methyltransferase RlmN [Clostridiales bacterium]|nr:23S rRNA (adenine(2503)-C(2))-methyltransferase RlmN [Clostridiales bacterium]
MTILLDYDREELHNMLDGFGEPKYRVDQLFSAMYSGKDYGDNINVPYTFKNKLQELGYVLQPIKIRKAITSSGKDKTIKFLYDLPDGNIIEGVLMKYAFGNTLCVSTQVGCKMNCAFCASGLNGFVRNLSCGEILGQIVAVNKYLGGSVKERQITNVVLMGSGEPLDNFDNLKKFLKVLTADDMFNMSVRNISVSTCGIPSKIEELADLGYAVTLCLSLHASNDNARKEIMPIAKRYSIAEVLDSLKYYHTMTNRRIIIEYTLIEGKNNSFKNAKELADLLGELPCHINLIKLNEVDGRNLISPTQDSCKKFLGYLNRLGLSATMRRSLGDDIEGACGQLRNKELKDNKVVIKENEFKPKTKPLPNKNTRSKVKDVSKLNREKDSKKRFSNPLEKKSNSQRPKQRQTNNRRNQGR